MEAERLDQIMAAIIRYHRDRDNGLRATDPFERTPGWLVLERAMKRYRDNYKKYRKLVNDGRFKK